MIFHIDVNNAFLSWSALEILKESKLDIRNIPSVIGGDEKIRHGVVLAKSTIAKKIGIKTAMTLNEARKIYPNLKIYPPNYKLYKEKSIELIKYLSKYSKKLEQFSIDECFIKIYKENYQKEDYIKLAKNIKDNIYDNFGYTVNIGIGENKLCAKMASNFKKPNKVHTLFSDEITTKMWPLDIGELFSVGIKNKAKFNKLGINKIKDLANYNFENLKPYFKNQSERLYEFSRGKDKSVINNNRKNKTISIEKTLIKNTTNEKILKRLLLLEIEELNNKLIKRKKTVNTISIIYKNKHLEKRSIQQKLKYKNSDKQNLTKEILDLFNKTYNKEEIRLIGIKYTLEDQSSYNQIKIAV